MTHRSSLGALTLAIALCLPLAAALAQDKPQDLSKYPANWEGQWRRAQGVGAWDPSKPPGAGQQAPLTPEYQAIFEANIKKLAAGKDVDPKSTCAPPGMPRVMMVYQPMEIVIKPTVTYLLIESPSPIRRIYTDGRSWPKQFLPAFGGYSIGQWEDTDGDGRYDTLNIETRGISGTRLFDGNGIQLHADDMTIIKEKISLDKANPDVMKNEITTIDNALTRPWTVTRLYRREKEPSYAEYNCEDNHYVVINGENYLLGVDGFLMPLMKDQPPPDLRYFKPAQK
jgi:hypothetical protein